MRHDFIATEPASNAPRAATLPVLTGTAAAASATTAQYAETRSNPQPAAVTPR